MYIEVDYGELSKQKFISGSYSQIPWEKVLSPFSLERKVTAIYDPLLVQFL